MRCACAVACCFIEEGGLNTEEIAALVMAQTWHCLDANHAVAVQGCSTEHGSD